MGQLEMGPRYYRPNICWLVAHRIPFLLRNAPLFFSLRNMFWKCGPKPKSMSQWFPLSLTETDHGFANKLRKIEAVNIPIGHLFNITVRKWWKMGRLSLCQRKKLCADLILLPDSGSSPHQKWNLNQILQRSNRKNENFGSDFWWVSLKNFYRKC